MRQKTTPLFILFSIFLTVVNPGYSQFQLVGDAIAENADCFRLTNSNNGQRGAIWHTDEISVNANWEMDAEVSLGSSNSGADGMAFVLRSGSAPQLGGSGGLLGYGGMTGIPEISPSISVQIDTYQGIEYSDPNYDHLAILSNGSVHHQSANALSEPVPADPSFGNIEDNSYHALRVTFDATTNLLVVFFDDVERTSATVNLQEIIGSSFANWGFTASTGGLANTQRVCNAVWIQELTSGCTDSVACNFEPLANSDDGSCVYPPEGAADCNTGAAFCGEGTVWNPSLQACNCLQGCPTDLNQNGVVEVTDLLLVLADFGEICQESNDDELSCEPVSYQGYQYATVAIAGNCWFAENLRADSYRNGDVIETLTGSTSQDCDLYYSGIGLAGVYGATWGCWSDCTESFDACSENTNSLNAFGRYYNGHAIVDPRGLCPSGWHPSTDEEWIELEVFAGMTQTEAETFGNRGSIAPLLKTSELWCDDNSGTDELGFMAVPAGLISHDCGASVGAMGEGQWWSLSEAGGGTSRILNAGDNGIWRSGPGDGDYESPVMFSIRCVQDAE